jgi:hypothetical protein
MQNTQTSTLLKRKFTFNILNSIETEIEITKNPYQLPVEDLFVMAARINKKRSFLFVSKVLGKHLPIVPSKGLLTGALLAARYFEEIVGAFFSERERLVSAFLSDESKFYSSPFLPERLNPVIIGFAETATALGHAFFDCFKEAEYFHTTREELKDVKPIITFEEEHSHATAHRCYIPIEMINNGREIILVDDEITTGKTALNIIESIQTKYPRDNYTIVSILDWRSTEHIQALKELEQKLGITIQVVSLIAGNVSVNQSKAIMQKKEIEISKKSRARVESLNLSAFFTSTNCVSYSSNQVPYIKETGRFGLKSKENETLKQRISKAAAFLKEKKEGEKTLYLGTGEFMYLPMKIASEMGTAPFYQSTTRSPIYIEKKDGYGARSGVTFPNPEEQTILNFVYNIEPGQYDELFIFFERELELIKYNALLTELEKLQFQSIKLVFFSGSEMLCLS